MDLVRGGARKRKYFKGYTQKHYEIHAINGDKAIGLYFYWI